MGRAQLERGLQFETIRYNYIYNYWAIAIKLTHVAECVLSFKLFRMYHTIPVLRRFFAIHLKLTTPTFLSLYGDSFIS